MNGATIRPAAVSASIRKGRCLSMSAPLLFPAGGAKQPVRAQHQNQRHGDEQHDVRIARVEHRRNADDLPGDQAAKHRPRKGADAADDDHHKVCTRMASPTSGAIETTGALTMPAKPAAMAPIPNTSMKTL